ncbi:MAG: serine/threonine-protein phosphatase, partial [Acidimicrobiales bacterium]|nr:serine/threonine-protein phosphatase [Acidimicrobiales bacterium]
LRWASAGHLPLLRVGAEAAFLEAPTGLPLGVDPDGEVQAREVVLDPGDRVVAFTDGLVETRGEELGASLERVRAQLDRWGPLGIEATVAALVEARNDDSDDLAVLGIELCGAQTP